MVLVQGVVLWGLLYFLCFFLPLFSLFFFSSPSLFCFCWKKRCDQNLWLVVLCWGFICMDGKHKTRKMIQKPLLGLLALWGGRKKVIEKLLCNDFISLGLKAWVILMDKPQHFWGVLAHAILGVVLGEFLSFDFLSVVVISDCLHDSVWITCKSVLCVNFIFSLCQCNPEKFMGRSFPSLSPFPSHLLWFPFVWFENQRHRALCPDFNFSARERCLVHAWCPPQGWPTQKWSGAADSRAMENWDLFTRRGKN